MDDSPNLWLNREWLLSPFFTVGRVGGSLSHLNLEDFLVMTFSDLSRAYFIFGNVETTCTYKSEKTKIDGNNSRWSSGNRNSKKRYVAEL